MVHTPSPTPGYFMHDLEWLACWFRNARFLEARADRVAYQDEILHYLTQDAPSRFRENLCILVKAVQFKGYGVPQGPYLITMMAYGEGRRLAVGLAMVAYVLVPGWLALRWDDWSRRRRGLPAGQARAVFAQRQKERFIRM